MSVDRISPGSIGPIDRSGAGVRTPAEVGEASVRSVALAVVGRIASELSLAGEAEPLDIDPYRLRPLGDWAAAAFPDSSPAAVGDLGRAIEALAGVVAADMASLSDGRTLERVDQALAGFSPAAGGVDGVTEFLNEAARRIAEAR